ncbi:MAG: DUF131 domain-containing protein [Candidatus Thorarchaeota archaeon]
MLNPQSIAFVIILTGILLILLGFHLSRNEINQDANHIRKETRAVVFIGPIPLVWGFSRRTQIILAIAAISIFIAMLLLI